MSDFENVVKNLKNIALDQNVSMLLGGKKDLVNKTVDFLSKQISAAGEDAKVYVSSQDRGMVLEACRFVNDIFLEAPVNNVFLQFMQLFSLLLHNWNENIAHDVDINRYSRNLDRLGRYQISSLETLDMLKVAMKKLREHMAYGIPASELSRHYLESIDEKLRVDSEENNAGDKVVCG